MSTPKRTLWMPGDAQGGPFNVWETAEDIDYDGVKCKGLCEVTAGRRDDISVSAKQGLAQMKQTLLHEQMHKCWGTASGDLREFILGEKTPEKRARREELITSFLEPVLYDLLARNGWLKYPDPPAFRRGRR